MLEYSGSFICLRAMEALQLRKRPQRINVLRLKRLPLRNFVPAYAELLLIDGIRDQALTPNWSLLLL